MEEEREKNGHELTGAKKVKMKTVGEKTKKFKRLAILGTKLQSVLVFRV